MGQEDSQKYITRKSFELSYILFRVGERIRHKIFAENLEIKALELLNAANSGGSDIENIIKSIEQLIRLGSEMNFIHKESGNVIIAELDKIVSTLPDLENPAKINIQNLIPQQESKRQRKSIEHADDLPDYPESGNAIMRQNALLEKIRQLGNLPDKPNGCRLKDILDAFPGISERTLRYDLSKLLEKNAILRLGTGGPATYYRVVEALPPVIHSA